MVADADGAREKLLLESNHPIMSPSWSPDAKELVYVSFETGRPAIFRQKLSNANREQLTNFKGLNGSPILVSRWEKISTSSFKRRES